MWIRWIWIRFRIQIRNTALHGPSLSPQLSANVILCLKYLLAALNSIWCQFCNCFQFWPFTTKSGQQEWTGSGPGGTGTWFLSWTWPWGFWSPSSEGAWQLQPASYDLIFLDHVSWLFVLPVSVSVFFYFLYLCNFFEFYLTFFNAGCTLCLAARIS